MIEQDVPTSKIIIPEHHKRLSTENDDSLKRSIQSEGLKIPVILVSDGNRLILADGFRRLKVFKSLSKDIPALIYKVPSTSDPYAYAATLRIVSNHHRQEFYPSQRAHYLKLLTTKYNVPVSEIAKGCGVALCTVQSWMMILDCSKEIKMMIDNGKLPVMCGRTLSTLKAEGQNTIISMIRDRDKITARELDRLVRGVHRKFPHMVARPIGILPKITKAHTSALKFRDISIVDAQRRLEELEHEITFMRREILKAKPIIEAMLKSPKIRLALPSECLGRFEVFAKEENFNG